MMWFALCVCVLWYLEVLDVLVGAENGLGKKGRFANEKLIHNDTHRPPRGDKQSIMQWDILTTQKGAIWKRSFLYQSQSVPYCTRLSPCIADSSSGDMYSGVPPDTLVVTYTNKTRVQTRTETDTQTVWERDTHTHTQTQTDRQTESIIVHFISYVSFTVEFPTWPKIAQKNVSFVINIHVLDFHVTA